MKLLILILFASQCAWADFYVDSGRSSSGDGSASNPWKTLTDIDWAAVSNSVRTADTKLYFSSRATFAGVSQTFPCKCSGTSSFRFWIIGDEFYNTVTAGTAIWNAETTGSKAQFMDGSNFVLSGGGLHDFTLKGFHFQDPLFSTIGCFITDPTTNVWNVSFYNVSCNTNINGHGFAGDYFTAACSNILVSGCAFSNTYGEAIYMGHFDDLIGNIRGIIVESNICVNTGFHGEGDIDIKPPCTGAIIRYNQHFRTAHGITNTSVGVAVAADQCQVYGNTFWNEQTNGLGGWGVGVYVTADGDATTGKAITSCLVYNNLLHDNESSGIKALATTATTGADISGLQIYNNTIVGNWISGIELGTGGSRTVSAVATNNILAGNTNSDFSVGSGVTLSANFNLYYRTSGNSWLVSGTTKTWAQWQALGYDANGIQNSDPLLASNYSLKSGSPAINAGVTISSFSTDINSQIRSVPWDIGAFEFSTYPSTLGSGTWGALK